MGQLVLGIGAQAQILQLLQLLPVGREAQLAGVTDVVEEDRQRPLGGLARIELPQRPGRRVARVHERRLAGHLALRVQLREVGLADEHLAARFED